VRKRERERKREIKRQRDVEYGRFIFIFKRNYGCLGNSSLSSLILFVLLNGARL
jgi:hypothetical protein